MRRLVLISILAACTKGPTPTGTVCPDPDPIHSPSLTWFDFGKPFMFQYCVNCHDSSLQLNQRNGAPLFHDFNTLEGVMEVPDHIDEQAGWGPDAQNNFMPGAGTNGRCPSTLGGPLDEACPEPTGSERTQLAQWIACEKLRVAANVNCYGPQGQDPLPDGGCPPSDVDAGIDAGSGSGSGSG